MMRQKTSRRNFIKFSTYKSLSTLFFTKIFYSQKLQAQQKNSLKKDLHILNDRPFNAQTHPHLLDDDVTPTSRMFVRNNGIIPEIAQTRDLSKWTLSFHGEIERPTEFNMQELVKLFKMHTYQLLLECGGNGRAAYYPTTPGNQWTYGAVACPLWTGIRLIDILNYLGLKKSAKYIAYYGMDLHPSGDPSKEVISRGFPIYKAFEETTIIALKLNHQDLPAEHGFPARLVCPGFPASASGKWLKKIWIRDKIHDGAKMNGMSYKTPKYPIAPGGSVLDKDMKIIEQMPVKSLITFPKSNTKIKELKKIHCRGFAWSGNGEVKEVHISYDYGQTWLKTSLKKPRNDFAWQRWEIIFNLPSKGYFEIWSRATDKNNRLQPMVIPGWNPKGYLNNAMPRISLHVG